MNVGRIIDNHTRLNPESQVPITMRDVIRNHLRETGEAGLINMGRGCMCYTSNLFVCGEYHLDCETVAVAPFTPDESGSVVPMTEPENDFLPDGLPPNPDDELSSEPDDDENLDQAFLDDRIHESEAPRPPSVVPAGFRLLLEGEHVAPGDFVLHPRSGWMPVRGIPYVGVRFSDSLHSKTIRRLEPSEIDQILAERIFEGEKAPPEEVHLHELSFQIDDQGREVSGEHVVRVTMSAAAAYRSHEISLEKMRGRMHDAIKSKVAAMKSQDKKALRSDEDRSVEGVSLERVVDKGRKGIWILRNPGTISRTVTNSLEMAVRDAVNEMTPGSVVLYLPEGVTLESLSDDQLAEAGLMSIRRVLEEIAPMDGQEWNDMMEEG